MTTDPRAIVAEFGRRLTDLGWVTALHVGGSLATGDHRPGTSDLDLVAGTDGPVTAERKATLRAIHEAISPAAQLGCTYVPAELVAVPHQEHATWTHGQLIQRRLSGIARAELVRHGYALFGREPSELWPPMSANDVRQAVVEELDGYWTWAARRPWLWFSTGQIDLAVTTMLRARHTLSSGELITKSAVLAGDDATHLPALLVHGVRTRREAVPAPGPRLPGHAIAAWRLTRRTIRESRADPVFTSRG